MQELDPALFESGNILKKGYRVNVRDNLSSFF